MTVNEFIKLMRSRKMEEHGDSQLVFVLGEKSQTSLQLTGIEFVTRDIVVEDDDGGIDIDYGSDNGYLRLLLNATPPRFPPVGNDGAQTSLTRICWEGWNDTRSN